MGLFLAPSSCLADGRSRLPPASPCKWGMRFKGSPRTRARRRVAVMVSHPLSCQSVRRTGPLQLYTVPSLLTFPGWQLLDNLFLITGLSDSQSNILAACYLYAYCCENTFEKAYRHWNAVNDSHRQHHSYFEDDILRGTTRVSIGELFARAWRLQLGAPLPPSQGGQRSGATPNLPTNIIPTKIA